MHQYIKSILIAFLMISSSLSIAAPSQSDANKPIIIKQSTSHNATDLDFRRYYVGGMLFFPGTRVFAGYHLNQNFAVEIGGLAITTLFGVAAALDLSGKFVLPINDKVDIFAKAGVIASAKTAAIGTLGVTYYFTPQFGIEGSLIGLAGSGSAAATIGVGLVYKF